MNPPNRISPAENNEAETENLVGNRDESNSTPVREYPDKIELSVEAEEYLSALVVDLHSGIVNIHQLPDSLFALFSLAWDRGCVAGYDNREQELRPRIRRLEFERDLYYFCYANRKNPADFRRAQTSELWRQGSQVAA